EPIAAPPVRCPLLISQVSTSPVLLLRQSTSPVPSPSKSPIPANCQALDTELTPVPPAIWPLFISHVSTAPVPLLYQSTSVVPSLSAQLTVRVGLAPELLGLAPAWKVTLSSTCW